MKNSKVYDCTMLELDRHHSNRKGNISVMENDKTVPFQAKRLYYLYDVPGIWRTLDDFSSGSVCLVLASEIYDAEDYIRSYDDFLKYKMYEAPEILIKATI